MRRTQMLLLVGVVMIVGTPILSAQQTNRDVAIGTAILRHIAAEFPEGAVLGIESTDQPALAHDVALAAKGKAVRLAQTLVCDQPPTKCRVKEVRALVRLWPLRIRGDSTVSVDVDLWWNHSHVTDGSATSRRRYRLARARGTWEIIDVRGIFIT